MKRVWKAVMVLGALVGVGTIGYYVLEDMTLLDALYMTVTTISTVGFGEVLEMLRTNNIPYVEGDATSASTLLTAGVARARGLATALSGDADNALVVISAKGPNPHLQVVARASSREIEEKLFRAGADRVVTPYTIGGQRMALGVFCSPR